MNLAKTYDQGKIVTYNGSAKASFAEIVSVNVENGEYKRNMLFSNKESKTAVIPYASAMIDGHCFIYSVRGKRKQFTTLTF